MCRVLFFLFWICIRIGLAKPMLVKTILLPYMYHIAKDTSSTQAIDHTSKYNTVKSSNSQVTYSPMEALHFPYSSPSIPDRHEDHSQS